jgi:hypothetical protein
MQDQVISFEQACQVLGINPDLPGVDMLPEKNRKAIVAHYKLIKIVEAANFIDNGNQPWEPDWKDVYQTKHYFLFCITKDNQFFKFRSRPSGLMLSTDQSGHKYAYVGPGHFCAKTEQLKEYISHTFIDLFEDLMLN